jgi:hypothetical protein
VWHDWPLLQIVGSDIDDSTMNASSWVHHSQILCLPSSRGVQAIDSSVLHHQAQAHADPDVAAGACRPQQGLLQPAGGAATTGLGQDDVGSEDTARACIDSGLLSCNIVSPVTQQSRQALDPRAEVLSASLLLQTHNKNQLHNHLSEWTFWQGLVRTK